MPFATSDFLFNNPLTFYTTKIGFKMDQYYPPPMDAWSKMKLGWANVITLSQLLPDLILPHSLEPSCQSNVIYKITANFPSGEYLLLENRQKMCLYDSQMGGSYSGGLAIYHIDENQPSFYSQGYPGQSGWPGNGNHYKVALIQADNTFELEKLLNRGNYVDLFHDGAMLGPSTSISSGPFPNSDSYAYGRGVKKTGVTISNIVTSGHDISFVFTVVTPNPTSKPTLKKPTRKPSRAPSLRRSKKPTKKPTSKPSPRKPSRKPTMPKPTKKPTRKPSLRPSKSRRPS